MRVKKYDVCVNKPFAMGASDVGPNDGPNITSGHDKSLVLNKTLQDSLGKFLDATFVDKDYVKNHPIARTDDMASFGLDIEKANHLYTQQTDELHADLQDRTQRTQKALNDTAAEMRLFDDATNWYCHVFDNIRNVDTTDTQCAQYSQESDCSSFADCIWDGGSCAERNLFCQDSCCKFPHPVHMRGNLTGRNTAPLVVRRMRALKTPKASSCPIQHTAPAECAHCAVGKDCVMECTQCGPDKADPPSLDLVTCYAPNSDSPPHTCVNMNSESGIQNCETYNSAPVIAPMDPPEIKVEYQEGFIRCPAAGGGLPPCDDITYHTHMPMPSSPLPVTPRPVTPRPVTPRP